MEGNKLTIHVTVDGMTLPMVVTNAEQEETIRKAAGNVNQLLNTIRETYSKVPNDNYYYAMAMLKSEVKALTEEKKSDATPIFEALDDLTDEIDKVLAEE